MNKKERIQAQLVRGLEETRISFFRWFRLKIGFLFSERWALGALLMCKSLLLNNNKTIAEAEWMWLRLRLVTFFLTASVCVCDFFSGWTLNMSKYLGLKNRLRILNDTSICLFGTMPFYMAVTLYVFFFGISIIVVNWFSLYLFYFDFLHIVLGANGLMIQSPNRNWNICLTLCLMCYMDKWVEKKRLKL